MINAGLRFAGSKNGDVQELLYEYAVYFLNEVCKRLMLLHMFFITRSEIIFYICRSSQYLGHVEMHFQRDCLSMLIGAH